MKKKLLYFYIFIKVLESITALINIFVIIITISKNLNSHTIDFSYED